MNIEIVKDDVYGFILQNMQKKFGIDRDSITDDSNLLELSKGNPYKVSLLLMDLHEGFDISIKYSDINEKKLFNTVKDIVQYFEKQI